MISGMYGRNSSPSVLLAPLGKMQGTSDCSVYPEVRIVTPVLCIPGHITVPGAWLSVFSHCQELCELEIVTPNQDDVELNLLSSITSAKIEKIVISRSTAFQLPVVHAYWSRLDDILSRLVEGLEPGLRLVVEFREVSIGLDERRLERLPMFLKKGRMAIFDENELLYCSDNVGERT